MNICFVYKNYPLEGNLDSGIGRYLSELITELKKKNKITILTTSNKTRVVRENNLTIYTVQNSRFPKRSLAFIDHLIKVAITLSRVIKKEKIDIIEFANWESEGLLYTSFVNIFSKVPVVVRLHTPSAIDHKFNNRKKYLSEKLTEYCEKKFVMQKQNHLTTSTKFNAKECRKIYDLKNKHIEIIPLGIKPKKLFSKTLDTSRHSPAILYVGRIEPRKGVDILLKAMPKILKKDRNTRFIIVGQENADSGWVDNLKSYIPFEYLDRVNFLGYIKNLKTLERLYLQSDVCIIPSRYESFGLTVLDSMSYGNATVASSVGGIPEIITNGIDGVLIKKLTLKDFALAIQKATNPNLQKLVRKNAITTVKQKFNVRDTALKTIEFYSQLTGQ